MIRFADSEIVKIFFNDIGIKRVYFGNKKIYERKSSYIYIHIKGFNDPEPIPTAIVGQAVVGEAVIGIENIAVTDAAMVGQSVVG